MNQILLNYKNKIFSILSLLNRGDKRTIIAKKNIFASLLIKGANVFLTLIMVPLLINYLDPIKYGLWLTITSIIQWLWFFDVGLGNGLRNKFAEAIALGDKIKAKYYVSTAYFLISIFSISIIIIFSPIIFSINWNIILNVPNFMNDELKKVVFFVFLFFMIRFIFQLIGALLLGAQKSAINDVINPASNLISIILILIVVKLYSNSFLLVSLALSISPVIVCIILSFYFFSKNFKDYKPSYKYVRLEYGKSLFNLGILFFIVQLSGVILYSATNLLIVQLLSPKEVTEYNIAYKYFNIVLMLFSIVVSPYWSAFTEAYSIKDFDWIKKTMNKLRKFSYISILGLIFLLLLSDFAYKIWIGNKIIINPFLSFFISLLFIIFIFNMPYTYFLNGIGKIKEQAIYSIIAAIIHIPLSIFLVKVFNLGVEGITLSLVFVSLPSFIIYPYIYNREINRVKL